MNAIFHLFTVCGLTFSSHKEYEKYGEIRIIWRKEHGADIAPRLR